MGEHTTMTLTMQEYDAQEEFLEELIDSLRSMKSCARDEELFESIEDIMVEVKEKMKELKLTVCTERVCHMLYEYGKRT